MRSLTFTSLVRSSLRFFALGAIVVFALCHPTGASVAAPDDDAFFTHLHTEKAMANVTVSPGRSGPVDIEIQLETVDETPLAAKSVSITLSDVHTGRKLPTLVASRSGENGWQAKVASLSTGTWMLGLDIAISDTDGVRVESAILIK